MPRGSPSGRSMAHSIGPAGPATACTTVRGVILDCASTAHVGRQHEALDDAAVLEVRVDDLVDVVAVDVGVPDRLGIDDRHGAAGTAVQAPGFVDAHLSR